MADVVKVAEFSSTEQNAIVSEIEQGVPSANNAQNGCAGFKLISSNPFFAPTYFGVDVKFSCAKNGSGIATTEIDRYMYTGDGKLYHVSVVAEASVWQSDQTTFEAMDASILPK
jgi:hypothetical protein